MAKYLTKFGMAAIRDRIARVQQKRDEALSRAGEAAQNDSNSYHDNFEYEEGMRQQEMLSQQLRGLFQLLEGAMPVPEPASDERVSIGHRILLRERGATESEAYVLCGDGEGALLENACSAASPLGQVLLGMSIGETRMVSLGGRSFDIEVLEIRAATTADFESAEE